MNLLLFSVMTIVGLFALCLEINSERDNSFLSFVIIILFVFTSISRVNGYHDYSDLGAYISRFQTNENAYFGLMYSNLTSILRLIIGDNPYGFVGVISIIILMIALFSVISWDSNYSKINICGCRNVFLASFLVIFITYWGACFSMEVIRTGIAIVLSFVSISYAKRRKIIPCLIFFFLSVSFHWTEIFLVPVLISFFIKKKKIYNYSFLSFFVILCICFDFLDISLLVSKLLIIVLRTIIVLFANASHYLFYLEKIGREEYFEFITLQYIYYRFLAFVLIYMKNRTPSGEISILYSYLLGLFVFSLMNDFLAVTRMQWVFAAPSVFLVYDYVRAGIDYKFNKILIVGVIIILQFIMAANYLK